MVRAFRPHTNPDAVYTSFNKCCYSQPQTLQFRWDLHASHWRRTIHCKTLTTSIFELQCSSSPSLPLPSPLLLHVGRELWAQWKSANCQPNYRVPGVRQTLHHRDAIYTRYTNMLVQRMQQHACTHMARVHSVYVSRIVVDLHMPACTQNNTLGRHARLYPSCAQHKTVYSRLIKMLYHV